MIIVSLNFLAVDSAYVPTAYGLNGKKNFLNRDGLLYDEADCRTNEVYRECGHAAICDRTCENKDEPYIDCPPICVRRCICDYEFVRNYIGDCIRSEQCPN